MATTQVSPGPILAVLAAAALGGLHALAFAPVGWWWLGVLSVAGLGALLERLPSRGRVVIACGAAYGLAFAGGVTPWLVGALQKHPDISVPLAWVITVGAMAYVSLPWVLVGIAHLTARRLPAWARLLLVDPAAALVGWWLTSWTFGGLPWVIPAYGQIDSPLAALFSLGGYQLVNYGTLLWAAFAALVFTPSHRIAIAGVIAVPGLAALLGQIQWIEPLAAPIRVGVVQTRALLDDKPSALSLRDDFTMNLRISRALVRRHGARVVIWPEGAVHGRAADWARAVRDGLSPELVGVDFVLGLLVTEPVPPAGIQSPIASGGDAVRVRHNTALASGASSQGLHVKRNLLPFGEYWPEWQVLRWIGAPDKGVRSRGGDMVPGAEHQALLQVAGHSVAASICYEDLYPGPQDAGDVASPAWLINLSNDAWFDSHMAAQHLAVSRARAMEWGRYLVRAANVGPSAVVDPHGHVVTVTRYGEIAMLAGAITPMQGRTPFSRWGHRWVGWHVLIVGITAVGIGLRNSRGNTSPVRGADCSTSA